MELQTACFQLCADAFRNLMQLFRMSRLQEDFSICLLNFELMLPVLRCLKGSDLWVAYLCISLTREWRQWCQICFAVTLSWDIQNICMTIHITQGVQNLKKLNLF